MCRSVLYDCRQKHENSTSFHTKRFASKFYLYGPLQAETSIGFGQIANLAFKLQAADKQPTSKFRNHNNLVLNKEAKVA